MTEKAPPPPRINGRWASRAEAAAMREAAAAVAEPPPPSVSLDPVTISTSISDVLSRSLEETARRWPDCSTGERTAAELHARILQALSLSRIADVLEKGR